MSELDASKKSVLARGTALLGSTVAMVAIAPQFSGMDPVALVLSIVFLVISLGIHEAAHAWVALKCGDPTGRDLGRITLNPIPHIDPFMTLILPAMLYYFSGGRMMFGGAKPVPVSFHRLRHPYRDMSLVAMAGPLSNLLLAVFFWAAAEFFVEYGLYNGPAPSPRARWDDLLPKVLVVAASTNVLLAVFNMIPIPPLDGSRLMEWLLPEGLRPSYARLGSIGIVLVIGLIYFVPGFNRQLEGAIYAVITGIDALIPIRSYR